MFSIILKDIQFLFIELIRKNFFRFLTFPQKIFQCYKALLSISNLSIQSGANKEYDINIALTKVEIQSRIWRVSIIFNANLAFLFYIRYSVWSLTYLWHFFFYVRQQRACVTNFAKLSGFLHFEQYFVTWINFNSCQTWFWVKKHFFPFFFNLF